VLTDASFTAAAVRQRWAGLPSSLRSQIEARLGAKVTRAADQTGGFTHGTAARLVLADGSRVFAKAIAQDDELVDDYRAEARWAARLPGDVPAPRFRFDTEVDGWVVIVFDDIQGRHPDIADRGELEAVLTAIERLAKVLTPNPLSDAPSGADVLAPLMQGWRRFAAEGPPTDLDTWSLRNLDRLAELESHWAEAIAGDTLLHADLRPDNMLLTAAGEVMVVDWACACVGAAWVDLVVLLGSVAGLDAETIVRTHPVTRDVQPALIDAFVCALAGCWAQVCREPELPRSPHLRTFQARNAVLTRAWLAQRTGWT
jgi:aminoglycoside phosphotransferase (APT) family kinase protein